jgi:predicted transcriptional regulator
MLNKINWALAFEMVLFSGYTQKALGERVGISQTSVFKLKNGDVSEPSDFVGQCIRVIFLEKSLGNLPELPVVQASTACVATENVAV